MNYIIYISLNLRKYLVYDFLRKVISKLSYNMKMDKRIVFVKKINSFFYKPWLKKRKKIYNDNIFNFPHLNISNGYLIDKKNKFPYLSDAINDCMKIFNTPVDNIKKKYLVNYLDCKTLSNYDGLIKFCTSPLLIGTVSKYLGEFPVISSIEVWNSPPSDVHGAGLTGSQKFHLDNVSDRQMKVFVNLIDIGEENGPFSFISEQNSSLVCNKLSYGNVKNVDRLEDQDVYNIIDSSDLKKNIGPKGLVTFIDTCRCLHYGSRNTKKGRKLLMVQFTSIARADSRPFENFPEDIRNNKLNKLLFNPFHY